MLLTVKLVLLLLLLESPSLLVVLLPLVLLELMEPQPVLWLSGRMLTTRLLLTLQLLSWKAGSEH